MNPRAYCPIEKYGREVLSTSTPPKPFQVARTLSEINTIDNRYHYNMNAQITVKYQAYLMRIC